MWKFFLSLLFPQYFIFSFVEWKKIEGNKKDEKKQTKKKKKRRKKRKQNRIAYGIFWWVGIAEKKQKQLGSNKKSQKK